jgi:hypothetical protein
MPSLLLPTLQIVGSSKMPRRPKSDSPPPVSAVRPHTRLGPSGENAGTHGDFRERARQCVERAQSASPSHRRLLLELAAKWLHLAGMSGAEIELMTEEAKFKLKD